MFLTALNTRHNHAIIRRNLIGWWPLNEGSGDVARDMSGNGYNGTISGATNIANPFPMGGNALDFDGTNDGIALPADCGLMNAKSISFCAWLKAGSVAENEAAFGAETSTNNTVRWALVVQTGNVWGIRWRDAAVDPTGTAKQFSSIASALNSGNIQHVCATWDSVAPEQKIYVNGALVSTGTVATEALGGSASNSASLGRLLSAGNFYDRIMADARLYTSTADASAVLTAEEVAAIYAGRG